ncbi:hypothetical protein [Rhizobacter sp. Root1221]|uniref:hypothetical protein n=1 Tax=Rhizobacter sp. Root1221 TaxID=1736433 RepID=UPI0006F85018|nr:hypothetical protein [Rhizobacter sp. Root1221]KQW02266.1 hypothetical protein ASC87_13665 [Rhizobacter sp. Root1221]
MTMTRKGFLGAATGGAILLLLQACGGGDDDNSNGSSNSGAAAAPQCSSTGAAISGNHGHVLAIAAADLDSATDKTYSIAGTSSHDHSVTFTPAQLQALKAGQSVTVASTTTFQHAHDVTATCV